MLMTESTSQAQKAENISVDQPSIQLTKKRKCICIEIKDKRIPYPVSVIVPILSIRLDDASGDKSSQSIQSKYSSKSGGISASG